MEYRQLGTAGVKVSAIGLGTNQFGGKVDQNGVNHIIDGCLDLGVNFIDTANIYQQGRSEETLGIALKGKWDRFVVATKVYLKIGDGPNDQGASRYHIRNAVEDSLRRLQSDHIDLYQIHRWDTHTPIEETLRTLDDLVSRGKVRYVGASNFAAWQMAESNMLADFRGWAAFVTVQPHYHMFERQIEQELVPYCTEHQIGILPYFPLAGGFLTGKYKQGEVVPAGSRGESSAYVQQYMTDTNYAKVEEMTAWAEAHERSMVELAHAWLLANPQVSSVISGATRLEQVQGNAKAADWVLTEAELAEVNGILDS